MKTEIGYLIAETVTAVIRGARRDALHVYADKPDDPHGFVMVTPVVPQDFYDFYEVYFNGAETSSDPDVLATVEPREVMK